MELIARHTVDAHALLFEAEPMIHPHVLDAYEQAVAVLNKHHIPFRPIGGIALNLRKAGRPTKDVDLIVSRRHWQQARKALLPITKKADKMALAGPHGIPVKVWPEGSTHGEIAKGRGRYRAHAASKLSFTLKGDELAGLINAKLASYLSATDRLQDASDVQSLIKRHALPLNFSNKLAPAVRATYRRIWQGRL